MSHRLESWFAADSIRLVRVEARLGTSAVSVLNSVQHHSLRVLCGLGDSAVAWTIRNSQQPRK